MKKLTLLVLLVACKDDPPDLVIPDAAPDGGGICSPLAQSGCLPTEKCTWINDQDNPPLGHIGCAPDGTKAVGEACTDPPAGPMGYDDCVKGSACLAGECKQICDVNGGTPTCDQNHACTRYADFFESGGTAVAGVCDPSCDPLTQDLKVGANVAACGSTDATKPNSGCYGFDEFSCAPTGMSRWTLTDRQPPQTNAAGNPYLNGCAPGFIPFFYEGTGSTVTLCSGLCAALEIDNTKPASNDIGDANAIGKDPTQLKAPGAATCAAAHRGSGSNGSSSCRFIWPYLVDDSTGELPAAFDQSIYKDTLGVCFTYNNFKYDSDGNGNVDGNDMNYPSCTGLPPRSGTTTGDADDAADWGCQKLANSQFTSSGNRGLNPAMKNVRMPKQLEMELVRHSIN